MPFTHFGVSDSYWMAPWEQREFCEALLEYGLIKYSNARTLPLKKGGVTDIYINLRDARNNPKAISYIARVFAGALRRLGVKRFVEVPDSVSCFAGRVAEIVNIPMVTIREDPKAGRVSKARVIGEIKRGELLSVIDDVITDGASKEPCLEECLKAGARIGPLVVTVDRQQGWKQNFAARSLDVEVWAGITLHDVRRYLIENLVMERCDPKLEEKNPLILALDGKSWEQNLPILDELRTTGCIFKVNDLVLNEGIKNLVPNLQVYGRTMIDLKGHDIPNTLINIAKHLLPCPPWAVTVHGSGGEEMIRAVVRALEGTPTKVLVVTVLTSIDPNTCKEIYRRMPIGQVRTIAEIAHRAGAHGLVCSPEEVKELRGKYPHKTLVTPGVRSPGKDKGDQKRTGTPEGAIASGADHIVGGRQFTGAADPVGEVMRVLKEELRRV